MTPLRLATRGSTLARAQAELVAARLRELDAKIDIELVEILSEGDEDQQTPLRELGGRGVFVGRVEAALRDGRADLAVHSLKDVPTEPLDDLTIVAVLERADPRDALVASDGRKLADLPPGARVGTGSRRRATLLHALRPDLEIVAIRGNVDTRLRRVREGAYEAVVLAAAGLDRLGRLDEATQLFEVMAFPPAPGQGTIALQCRTDDSKTRDFLRLADHALTHAAVDAERGFLGELGTGCELPVAAYAQIDDGLLALRAMLGNEDETIPRFGDATGDPEDGERIGRELARRLRDTDADASVGNAG